DEYLSVSPLDAAQIGDWPCDVEPFAFRATGFPDSATPVPNACYGHRDESRLVYVVVGESPEGKSLLFAFDNDDWNLYIRELLRCDARWDVQPVRATTGPEIL